MQCKHVNHAASLAEQDTNPPSFGNPGVPGTDINIDACHIVHGVVAFWIVGQHVRSVCLALCERACACVCVCVTYIERQIVAAVFVHPALQYTQSMSHVSISKSVLISTSAQP